MTLDVVWLGRDTARNPIVLKSARRIEKDARWVKAKMVGKMALVAACLLITLALYAVAVP